ncbi:MAG: NADH-ubiquinone oxidoreductase subunit NDUFA12 family protein [Alphaproteobacteria bacterium]
MIDAPPSETPLETKLWQQPHLPNLTGTDAAYRPPGDPAKGDGGEDMPPSYEAWRP